MQGGRRRESPLRFSLPGMAFAAAAPSAVVAFLTIAAIPAAAIAQPTIAGTVTDSTGAPFKGVVVEASSPAANANKITLRENLIFISLSPGPAYCLAGC